MTIPIQVADYQQIKLLAGYETDVRPDETIATAYRRAWRVAEKNLTIKKEEYEQELKHTKRV